MKKLLIGIMAFFCLIGTINAEDLAPNSKSAILIDKASGEILFEKNSKEKLSPASMTKIASLLLIMEAIDEGKITKDENVTISETAANMGGSQIFLEAGDVYPVEELIKGVAIASGNDAVVALAEKVAGTTLNFVQMMNDKCKELGCTSSNFMNPHGLDEENHYSSAYDMSLLAKELLKYEDILNYTSIYEEYLTKSDGSKTWLVNTNRLVRFYPGVDGLKTGFTDTAGYCLTATALKNDLRLISVVMGNATSEARTNDTTNLLNYGFNSYKLFLIKEKEKSLGKVDIKNGKINEIDVYLEEDATDLQKITDGNKSYEFDIKLDEIEAPVNKGDIVGKADIIDNEGEIVDTVNIIVKENIEKASLFDYIIRNLKSLICG